MRAIVIIGKRLVGLASEIGMSEIIPAEYRFEAIGSRR
jgi:hypothetical protein